ncbi:MAG: DUF4124 domain-containing protein [Rhodocyclaceae bacterium]|nr:DUF4124 domain-containing protein [Rhodocyclaceae bacterium]
MTFGVNIMMSPRICVLVLAAAALAPASAQTYRWTSKSGTVNYADTPPPSSEVKKVDKLRTGPPNVVDAGGTPFEMQQASQDFPVTLFVSQDCEAECKAARDYLGRRGIPFSEKVLKTAEDAAAFKAATGIAELAVPSVLVGTKAQRGFEEGSWNQLIDAAGYPKTAPKTATK